MIIISFFADIHDLFINDLEQWREEQYDTFHFINIPLQAILNACCTFLRKFELVLPFL